ncbi:tight adherence pilus pseudopilin TadF [Vibrio paucivorans]
MNRSMITENKGSIVIETTIFLLFMSLVLMAVLDVARLFDSQSQVDKLSYSLVSIVKERERDYFDEDFSPNDELDELHRITLDVLTENNSSLDQEDITLAVKYPSSGGYSTVTKGNCELDLSSVDMSDFEVININSDITKPYLVGVCIDLSSVLFFDVSPNVFSFSILPRR